MMMAHLLKQLHIAASCELLLPRYAVESSPYLVMMMMMMMLLMMIGMRMILMGMMNLVAVMVDRQKSFRPENPILILHVMTRESQFGCCR